MWGKQENASCFLLWSEPVSPPLCSQSLLTFELFSVMVHSGSAAGGHYYACIKSFSDGQWYSFNDQHVSKVSPEQRSCRMTHYTMSLLIINEIVLRLCRARVIISVPLCFSVGQITQEDIRKTYGGSSGSRGYYSSAFARSVVSDVCMQHLVCCYISGARFFWSSVL